MKHANAVHLEIGTNNNTKRVTLPIRVHLMGSDKQIECRATTQISIENSSKRASQDAHYDHSYL